MFQVLGFWGLGTAKNRRANAQLKWGKTVCWKTVCWTFEISDFPSSHFSPVQARVRSGYEIRAFGYTSLISHIGLYSLLPRPQQRVNRVKRAHKGVEPSAIAPGLAKNRPSSESFCA